MSTFVLVHGSYQGGWVWARLSARLRSLGHDVRAPSLDGCGERRGTIRGGITTESQAAELASLLFHEDLNDVTLVGTSTGGMVVCKTAELQPSRVQRLAFVSALALLNGESVGDAVRIPDQVRDEVSVVPSETDARTRWLGALDEDSRAWCMERYGPHPRLVYDSTVRLEDFWQRSWAASVIWCKQSPNPPLEHQRRTARLLNARWHELDAGHLAAVSHPGELAAILDATVGG